MKAQSEGGEKQVKEMKHRMREKAKRKVRETVRRGGRREYEDIVSVGMRRFDDRDQICPCYERKMSMKDHRIFLRLREEGKRRRDREGGGGGH